jgi:hypothetical protein
MCRLLGGILHGHAASTQLGRQDVLHLYRGGAGELASDMVTYRQAYALFVIIFMLHFRAIFWLIKHHGYWSMD